MNKDGDLVFREQPDEGGDRLSISGLLELIVKNAAAGANVVEAPRKPDLMEDIKEEDEDRASSSSAASSAAADAEQVTVVAEVNIVSRSL